MTGFDKNLGKLLIADDHLLSKKYLSDRNWNCLVFPDTPDDDDVERLNDAIIMYDISHMFAIYFLYRPQLKVDALHWNKYLFFNIYAEYPIDNLIVTNERTDFLFFKEECNEYYIVAGDREFLKRIYAGSISKMKNKYLEYVSDSQSFDLNQTDYYKKILEKYSVYL